MAATLGSAIDPNVDRILVHLSDVEYVSPAIEEAIKFKLVHFYLLGGWYCGHMTRDFPTAVRRVTLIVEL